ncbi:hypothetical protein RF11_07463 [Thelohanellus kitauei]|uniref:Uncharacterized protein n=1 Tax=Thelohanellus kitauei TaxID=669202 RepID=A0A0C2JZB2_THEKT|nr:hypothetical protein RF11_07463 [Thelohanellus kitauei]
MSEYRANVNRSQEKKVLFFKIYIFIFRDLKLLTDDRTQPFIELLLKYIRTPDPKLDYNSDALIDSINICVSYEPNKIMFINENGMFYFYNYFIKLMNKSVSKFVTTYKSIYNIDESLVSFLNRKKLNLCVIQIMKQLCETGDDECAKLLLTVFKMLHRLGIFDEMKFYCDKLLSWANSLILLDYQRKQSQLLIVHLSKIFSYILNGPKNKFQIDKLCKLINLSALFAIDLSRKLKDVSRGFGNFLVTQNNKLKFYVIYLSLVAFPIIDHKKDAFLREILLELTSSFRSFFEKFSIDYLPLEHQTIIVQYYVRSVVTLKINHFLLKNKNYSCFSKRIINETSLGNNC